jgi:glycosyltransferase involved in cell wall biosynthesis
MNEEYNKLISRVRVLAFFSTYEGFGMPPVEAAMAGAYPVYSRIAATSETMMGCGSCFANNDYDSFAYSMECALNTAPGTIEEWRNQLLSCYNWDNVCERIIDGLSAAASQRR